MTFNQRSVDGILQMIRMLGRPGRMRGRGAAALAETLSQNLAAIGRSAERLPRRPRVFFEEWHNPLISGIQWVEELIALAGGDADFPRAPARAARDTAHRRSPALVRDAAPDVDPRLLVRQAGPQTDHRRAAGLERRARPFATATSTRSGSTYLLQPGPAALTEGRAADPRDSVRRAAGLDVDPALAPGEPWDRGGSRP